MTKRKKNSHIFDRDPNDFYIEEMWCNTRLFEDHYFVGPVFDPACGSGRIVQAARAAGYDANGSDIVDRCNGEFSVCDFLSDDWKNSNGARSLVSNPPFKIADKFIKKALTLDFLMIAMLLPAKWHMSARRSRWLKTTPLMLGATCVPRPSMPPGDMILAGTKPGSGKNDFSWYIWRKGNNSAPLMSWLDRDGGVK